MCVVVQGSGVCGFRGLGFRVQGAGLSVESWSGEDFTATRFTELEAQLLIANLLYVPRPETSNIERSLLCELTFLGFRGLG